MIGGHADPDTRYIAPTILDEVSWHAPIMEEEIFGPILPVLEYGSFEEAITLVNQRSKPLALYFFSRAQQKQKQILHSTFSGGVCLNDTVVQLVWGLGSSFWRCRRKWYGELSWKS